MDPQIFIDAARYAHILAVSIGFGAAFLADYHIISRLGLVIDDNLTTTLHLCHKVIWAMLVGMWVTGLVLIYVRTGFDPALFTPKLICKIAAVSILTANAILIGRFAVPLVEANRGRSLMWLPLRHKLGLAGVGAVSSASWMLALAMGSSKVLAASGWIVFAFLMPVIYFLGVFAAVAVMFLLHMGGEMVVHRPAIRSVPGTGATQRGPVGLPMDGLTLPKAADARPAALAPASTPLRERAMALRMAPDRRAVAPVSPGLADAVTVPAE